MPQQILKPAALVLEIFRMDFEVSRMCLDASQLCFKVLGMRLDVSCMPLKVSCPDFKVLRVDLNVACMCFHNFHFLFQASHMLRLSAKVCDQRSHEIRI